MTTEFTFPNGDDACTAEEAAATVGLHIRHFNRVRRSLERWRDGSGALHEVPPSAPRAWRRQRVIVVPEFGGVSQYGSDFLYSRAACEAWRRLHHPPNRMEIDGSG